LTDPGNTLVLVELPGGSVAAFPLAQVLAGRRRAQELGLAPRGAAISAPAPPGVAGHAPETTWVTVERLAATSGLKPAHIRASARAGLLPSRRVGRRVLLPANALSIGATALPAVSESDVSS
jgi:hypothetical protein